MWKMMRGYLSKDGKGWEKLLELMAEGYEPFSIVPHIFLGESLGDTIYFKKFIECSKKEGKR